MQKHNTPLITLNHIVKTYPTGAGNVTVLNDICLTIDAGEFVGVVGPSGSGKSTLMNMITGIDQPTSGAVQVAGEAVHSLNQNQLARWRGRLIGVIFQFFQLLPTLTILENVMLPMDFCNVYKSRQRKEKAMHLLARVGIAAHAYKLPNMLSGGQQQRAAIARALANDPPLIVADEPTGNLDSTTADEVFTMFQDLVDSGKTLLLVTHDRELSHRLRRTIHILDGQIAHDKQNQ